MKRRSGFRSGLPRATTWSPCFSVPGVQPNRVSTGVELSSNVHFSAGPSPFFPSTTANACGLFHANSVKVPSTSTVESRSKFEGEWGASAGIATSAATARTVAVTAPVPALSILERISIIPPALQSTAIALRKPRRPTAADTRCNA